MIELQTTLEFSCCSCSEPVSVTVKCAGKGLWQGARAVANVKVPCPNCGQVIRVWFEPSGLIREIALDGSLRAKLQPSMN